VLLRGRDAPPARSCEWLDQLQSAFAAWPRLGAAAHAGGAYWYAPALGDPRHALAPAAGPLFRDDAGSRLPLEFISVLDSRGPVALRADALRAAGGLLDAPLLAPQPGDCGVLADAELSLRLWAGGWYVARLAPHFDRGPRAHGDGAGDAADGARAACVAQQARARARRAVLCCACRTQLQG
jgi:hypothetical protein